nr:super-infection exclusion protein B [Escherichia coli]
MIVIWVGLLLLSPDNWPEYVNERIGIPHVWHVFVFALAFSLAINVHRLSAIASARYKRFKLRKRIKMQNWICPYISRHLLSLNPLQARCRRYSRGER